MFGGEREADQSSLVPKECFVARDQHILDALPWTNQLQHITDLIYHEKISASGFSS
jgi:hypothetical protein